MVRGSFDGDDVLFFPQNRSFSVSMSARKCNATDGASVTGVRVDVLLGEAVDKTGLLFAVVAR